MSIFPSLLTSSSVPAGDSIPTWEQCIQISVLRQKCWILRLIWQFISSLNPPQRLSSVNYSHVASSWLRYTLCSLVGSHSVGHTWQLDENIFFKFDVWKLLTSTPLTCPKRPRKLGCVQFDTGQITAFGFIYFKKCWLLKLSAFFLYLLIVKLWQFSNVL